MGDILHGIFDVPRDSRGRRLNGAEVAQVPVEIAGELSIVVQLVEETTETAVVEEQYDPTSHTVAEVLEYAAAHPETIPAIVAAEENGKQRKMILALV